MQIIILILGLINYAEFSVINYSRQQRLLIVSLDGFRHDYIERYHLDNFKSFLNKDQASKAPYMNPQFTTQTFPNHWSIVTGSYVENHGIIANSFFDPKLNETFSRENENYSNLKWWNSSRPIWFSSVDQGLKTASYFWPGSDALFSDSSLYKRLDFNKSITFENKVDEIINWFVKEKYIFITMYHHQPDAAAHRYGLDSTEFNKTIKEVDKSFGYLIKKLKESKLFDSDDFNLIVLSDHGMVNIKDYIILDDYINGNDTLVWSETGNLIHFKPLINQDIFFSGIKKIPNTSAYFKKDLPEKFHYKYNNRIGDIVLIADEGYGMILMYGKKLRNGQNPPENYEDKKKLL
ncbi:unnamed protein product [Brachionus calyciflorus]|uniref:Alkaline phosphatase family protein n=1 Tax=Brachionus calyciflorus TaxID=104777 RepID=A0A813XZJ0_9BILA|nr:unnamed protein product [Brachionus calyciflorus]